MRCKTVLLLLVSLLTAHARTEDDSIPSHVRFWEDIGEDVLRKWDNVKRSVQGLINPDKSVPGPLEVTHVSQTDVRYVALGDSYAAGSGSGGSALPIHPQDFDRCCHRNRNSYPALLARQLLVSRFEFLACGGAVSIQGPNSVEHQMKSAKSDAQFVTVTVGGNDMGFAKIITACLTSRFSKNQCYKALNDAKQLIRTQLPQDLRTLDKRLENKFPNATVLFTGYPLPYAQDGKGQIICIHSRSTQRKMNQVVELLNTSIKDSVRNFVQVSFEGHEMCERNSFFIDHIRPTVRLPRQCNFKRETFARLGGIYHVTAEGQFLFSRAIIRWYLNRIGN